MILSIRVHILYQNKIAGNSPALIIVKSRAFNKISIQSTYVLCLCFKFIATLLFYYKLRYYKEVTYILDFIFNFNGCVLLKVLPINQSSLDQRRISTEEK